MEAPGSRRAPRPAAAEEPEPQPEVVATPESPSLTVAPDFPPSTADSEPQMQLAGWLSHKGGAKEGGSTVGSWRKRSRRVRRFYTALQCLHATVITVQLS